jgi:hypothetical protein
MLAEVGTEPRPGLNNQPRAAQERMIFLVGAQRSGTNWLQRMLATHGDIVALPSETHLFSDGLAPLADRFQHGTPTSTTTGTIYMNRKGMLEAMRAFCDTAFLQLAELLDPGASRILERTPLHVHHLGLIKAIYPGAPVIHIIRDGRDVARSQVAQEWGPATMAEAAAEWASAIRDARAANVSRYVEVGYEDLLADPVRRVGELFEWLGLERGPEVDEAVRLESGVEFNVSRKRGGVAEGKWRATLDHDEWLAFQEAAGDVLQDLGYPNLEPPRSHPRTRTKVRHALGRASRVASSASAALRPGPDASAEEPVHFSLTTTQQYMARVGQLVDDFLELVAVGDYAGVQRLITDDTQVTVCGGSTRCSQRGALGSEQLVEALRADAPYRVRSLAADGSTHALGSTIVQTWAGEDGSVSKSVYVLYVAYHGDELSFDRVTYHRPRC